MSKPPPTVPDQMTETRRPSKWRLVFAIAMTALVPRLMMASSGYVAESFPGGAGGLVGLLGVYAIFALPHPFPRSWSCSLPSCGFGAAIGSAGGRSG